jgi:ABC-type microcin C transport system permease subunit YejB
VYVALITPHDACQHADVLAGLYPHRGGEEARAGAGADRARSRTRSSGDDYRRRRCLADQWRIVTETVFALPIGRLTVDAILRRDYPIIQVVILIFSAVYVLVNLAVDMSYVLFDPRIRLT